MKKRKEMNASEEYWHDVRQEWADIAEHNSAEEYDEDRDISYDYGDDESYDEEYDRCRCSDPGCPCTGWKRGGAP